MGGSLPPKSMGGMGFRDLRVFNQALLAKQGWRLYNNTNSLLYGVLKARYYKKSDFINAARGHDPSYSWRSIWGVKALLIDGLKWRVGNGSSIKVSTEQMRVFTSLCWAAWHCRNKHIFEGPGEIRAVEIARGFVCFSSDYGMYNSKLKGGEMRKNGLASSRSLPPAGVVKLNVDAHVREGAGVQFGAVIRDENGTLLAAAVKKCEVRWSSDMAEVGAMRYRLELARRLGFEKVALESDALTAVRVIQSKQIGAAPIFLLFDDVLKLSNEFSFFSCNHVKRAGNTVAQFCC
ncbi:uncharacterized protein LOC110696712 [Chenopodium quinoa]|uniref:uncharacterized protein LOC110696712 n=1 Tax=Chenopodium quinoa TaxID=63459 RepID=UPI000B7990AE|nr:uncharacterized protein LOC110696712 [Chenopodium quinoa]